MSLRLCSHIKTNGVKCGSPALRHNTLCYFHYQWQRRDQRRVRLGGPAGMNKNSGVELPLLDGPEAIIVSIGEIQHALVDQRIPIKMGTALLYSLQLALQARIPYSGLCGRDPVRECPELDSELELERAKSLRPAKEKCARCTKQDTCLSPRNCRKLPKLPTGYRREADRIVRDSAPPSSRAQSCSDEGPFVSSPEAPTLAITTPPETTPNPLRESSPGREPGESAPPKSPPIGAPHLPPSADVGSAHARRQTEEKQTMLRLRDSHRSPQDDTSKTEAFSHAHNILGFNANSLKDLAGKFPQLVETTQPEK